MLKNKNFAVSKLLAGIALDATSLSVLSADGIKFPASGTFRAVLWSQEYDSPIDDVVREIITMELDADDVFTITRAQEGTAAKAWLANDNLAHVLTAGKIDEIETVKIDSVPPSGGYKITNFYLNSEEKLVVIYEDTPIE